MIWNVCLVTSLIVLFVTLVVSFLMSKSRIKGKVFTSLNAFFAGVFIASVVLFIPVYEDYFNGGILDEIKILLLSLYSAIRLFLADGEVSFVTGNIQDLNNIIKNGYVVLLSTLYILAPVLTVTFVLSFFKTLSSYRAYIFGFFKETYIFSDLNEKSLYLAKDLKKNNKKRMIVFANTADTSVTLTDEAYRIGAICFKKKIENLKLGLHSKGKEIKVLLISKDESENNNELLALVEKYREKSNVMAYLFSSSKESEIIVESVDSGKIKIRRIKQTRSLVYRELCDKGELIYKDAVDNNGRKLISAVIVGMGAYGTEMTKALPWFGQMDGYDIKISAFDKAKDCKSCFTMLCPELMSQKYNGNKDISEDMGESMYEIGITDDINFKSEEFYNKILELEHITYIFVDLGSDEENLETALSLRELLLRQGKKPAIKIIISDSNKKDILSGAVNFKGQSYDIDVIGDSMSLLTEAVMISTDIEKEALDRHLNWGDEESFWKFEYNYKSSVASVIHRRMRIACKMAGAEKPIDKRTEAEKVALRKLEHRRWNTYMRSEGFSYSKDRNDLAKTHTDLVVFDKLPPEKQLQDDF